MNRLDRGIVTPPLTESAISSSASSDSLVQGTTYFFREPSAITTIVKRLVPAIGGQGTVASVGCSTGEEVYSLLLLSELSDLGDRVHVVGYDYDVDRLRRASEGIYEYGARHKSRVMQYRDAMMKILMQKEVLPQSPEQFTVPQSLHERAAFAQHDITTEPLPQQYPIILCANVLYHYFQSADRPPLTGILNNLAQSLEPGGYLVCEGKESFMSETDYEYRRMLDTHPSFIPREDLGIPFYIHTREKVDAARVLQRIA